jgi:hypothetical protein
VHDLGRPSRVTRPNSNRKLLLKPLAWDRNLAAGNDDARVRIDKLFAIEHIDADNLLRDVPEEPVDRSGESTGRNAGQYNGNNDPTLTAASGPERRPQ